MGDVAIRVENLSKQYRIGGPQAEYQTIRETLVGAARAPFRRLASVARGQSSADTHETIWALKDVSFEVKHGEVLGIIGRNGAGKSTLLKILSRITAPTEGTVDLYGRVGSLLEVGTGFHPELTGRENIYLNGAILGMTRAEIDRRFDEIVAFTELEKFLDTPVKHYSSGMYVRLAFSVAAHLEPEILLVDEVLAVGDVAFQKKCLGKMGSVAQQGRTVLFVSHNMQAIRNLCPRSTLLNEGKLISDTATDEAAQRYNEILRERRVDATTDSYNPLNRRGSGAVRFTDISVCDIDENATFHFGMGETVRFMLAYEVFRDVPELLVSVALRSGLSSEIITTVRHVVSAQPIEAGTSGTAIIELPDIYIRPGEYPLYYWLGDSLARPFDVVDDLTAPLAIAVDQESQSSDFVASSPVGYFSIPSRLSLA
jgi:lipopolysaccharide transport system ATP-binding protein